MAVGRAGDERRSGRLGRDRRVPRHSGARSLGWQDDHALIAAALDQPAGTNDLLIDIVRPALAAGARTRSRPAPAVSERSSRSCSRASKTPAAMRSSSARLMRSVAERLGRGGR